jgi:hypothetical protein
METSFQSSCPPLRSPRSPVRFLSVIAQTQTHILFMNFLPHQRKLGELQLWYGRSQPLLIWAAGWTIASKGLCRAMR